VKADLTDISIVLDRSGSMSSVRDDTIGGFNTFIKAQRELPGSCNVSLVQFDDHYESLYTAKPVKDAPFLNTESYVPRASTALLDAIGRTITDTGARLSAIPEADRPGKVIFVILTDGQENASREFTRERVFEMIKLQREVYKWDFVFLGANQDAIQTGTALGMAAGSTMTYASNTRGTKSAFLAASNYAARARSGESAVSFTAEDRQEQKDAGASNS
jgi:hypothetical protein